MRCRGASALVPRDTFGAQPQAAGGVRDRKANGNAHCAPKQGHTRQGDSPLLNTFVYRYSSSSSLSTITLCFLRRRSRSVCMLFTYSPPSPLLAMGVEGVGPNCMTLVSSWSLEGFVRFSVVSILSVAVREFVRRHAPANQLGVWRVERSERLAW